MPVPYIGFTKDKRMKTKEITRMALLTAIALTIFMVELQLPGLSPVPGIKLGLSNIVTVWAVFTMGPKKAAMILAARVFLGAVFSGQMSTILYSGAGGACAIGITILSRRFLTKKQIWVAGARSCIRASPPGRSASSSLRFVRLRFTYTFSFVKR